jgi:hypothetical protein
MGDGKGSGSWTLGWFKALRLGLGLSGRCEKLRFLGFRLVQGPQVRVRV